MVHFLQRESVDFVVACDMTREEIVRIPPDWILSQAESAGMYRDVCDLNRSDRRGPGHAAKE